MVVSTATVMAFRAPEFQVASMFCIVVMYLRHPSKRQARNEILGEQYQVVVTLARQFKAHQAWDNALVLKSLLLPSITPAIASKRPAAEVWRTFAKWAMGAFWLPQS